MRVSICSGYVTRSLSHDVLPQGGHHVPHLEEQHADLLVVLTTLGHIYTWGAGEQGQLGRKIIERRKIHGTTPEKVTLRTRQIKAVVVGAGNYSSYAVDEQGQVWGWGLNSWGQVGTGNEDEDDNPKVELLLLGA